MQIYEELRARGLIAQVTDEEEIRELVNNGKSPLDAHFEVSRLLGHERPDVTNIYLASVRKGDKHEQ